MKKSHPTASGTKAEYLFNTRLDKKSVLWTQAQNRNPSCAMLGSWQAFLLLWRQWCTPKVGRLLVFKRLA